MNIRLPLLLLLFLTTTFATSAQTVSPDYLDGHLYLKVEDASSVVLDPLPAIPALTTLLNTYGVDSLYQAFTTSDPTLDKIYRLEFTDLLNTGALISGLQALTFIEYAEAVPLIETNGGAYLPNDLQANQWHLVKINAEAAWNFSQGSPNVVVAIVDNAMSLTHQDLVPVLWTNPGEVPGNGLDDDFNGYVDDVHGADVADFDGNPAPPAGTTLASGWNHGTHCGGIASAATDNGKGIASIGFNLRLMAVKASANFTGGNTLERAYEGVDYAMRMGADVISMSWGSSGNSLTGGLIMSAAASRDIVLVAAAGNNNVSTPYYPAAYQGVFAVGSTDILDAKSGFSNYGSYIDVMAPGTGIYSSMASDTNAYADLSGTSMACPLVAGLAGLVKSAAPGFSSTQIEDAISAGCESIDIQNPAYIGQMGAGRINAFNTMSGLPVGIQENATGKQIVAYPNPAEDRFFLKLPKGLEKGSVSLHDLAGKQLAEWPLGTDTTSYNTAGMTSGLYLVRVQHGESVTTQKLILK